MNSDTGVQKRMLSHWREWSQQVDHLQALEEQRALQVEAERQQSMAVARIALERADADEAIKLAQSVTQAETARTAIRKLLQIKLFAGWRQWLGFIDHMQREATLDLLKDLVRFSNIRESCRLCTHAAPLFIIVSYFRNPSTTTKRSTCSRSLVPHRFSLSVGV